MEKNVLNIEITRPTQVLTLMRGVSGSGKSTIAKTLVGEGIIHSTDDVIEAIDSYNSFFREMRVKGDRSSFDRAHSTNLKNAVKSMIDGISPVVIDNTNIKANDSKEYVVKALEIGLSEENIQIIDIGTNGFSAEELAERNTHNVPIEAIQKMIDVHKSVGPLSVKKILESKDRFPKSDVLYTCILLGNASKNRLFEEMINRIPNDWDLHCHHMTIQLGEMKDKSSLGTKVMLRATHVGISDMAIAVKVEGYEGKIKNPIPHITVAVNPNGGKPVMSNDIVKWEDIKEFNLIGTITEIKRV